MDAYRRVLGSTENATVANLVGRPTCCESAACSADVDRSGVCDVLHLCDRADHHDEFDERCEHVGLWPDGIVDFDCAVRGKFGETGAEVVEEEQVSLIGRALPGYQI